MTRMKENVIAVVATLLLTGGVIAFMGTGNGNLATDLLGQKKQVQHVVDLNFLYNDDKGEMVLNRDVDSVASVSFEIMYDQSKLDFSRDSLDSKYSMSFAKSTGGNSYNVILQGVGDLKKSDILFDINNITKEQFDNINIGHIQVFDNNGNIMDLTSSK